MDLSKRLKGLVPISLLCLTVVAFAAEQSDARREQLDKELGESRRITERTAHTFIRYSNKTIRYGEHNGASSYRAVQKRSV